MSWFKNLLGIKPSEEEFVDIAEQAIRHFGEDIHGDLVFDQEHFSIGIREADGSMNKIFFLGNAYADYCAVPKGQRNEVLAAYFTQPPEAPKNLDEARANLLPRVQQRSFYEEMHLRLRSGDLPTDNPDSAILPYIVMAQHFAKGLVYDTPRSVVQINKQAFTDWGTDLETLLPEALSNLARLTPQPFECIALGVYLSQSNDTHDASRALLIDHVRECKLKGRPVAVLPNRNALIITGESDHEGQTLMLKIAEEVLKQPRPMAPLPLALSDSEWHPWQPAPDHPERKRFDVFRAIGMTDIYNTQKEVLDRIYEKNGTDIYVAKYMAVQHEKTGDIFSCCPWTNGAHSLLPVVDRITFVGPKDGKDEVLCTVPWEMVRECVGDIMKPDGQYPERFEVKQFPNENQMAQLTKHNML